MKASAPHIGSDLCSLTNKRSTSHFRRPLLLPFNLQNFRSLGSREPRGRAGQAPSTGSVVRGRHSPHLSASTGVLRICMWQGQHWWGLEHDSKSLWFPPGKSWHLRIIVPYGIATPEQKADSREVRQEWVEVFVLIWNMYLSISNIYHHNP